MDKWITVIKESADFIANVLTAWFVIRSLSGLTFRQMISRLSVRENLGKAWSSFTEFLRSLEYPEVQEESPRLPVQNATITPACGTLCINVFDTVSVGGTASCSGTLS